MLLQRGEAFGERVSQERSNLAHLLQERCHFGHVVLDGLQEGFMVAKVAHDSVCAPGCCHPAGRLVLEPDCQRPGLPALPAQLLFELKGLGHGSHPHQKIYSPRTRDMTPEMRTGGAHLCYFTVHSLY